MTAPAPSKPIAAAAGAGAPAALPPARRWREGGAAWLLAIPLALEALLFLVPIALLLALTVSRLGGEGIVGLLGERRFQAAVGRTLVLAAVTTLICLPLGVLYALCLAFARGWARAILFAVLLLSLWLSLLVRTYGWILLLQNNGVVEQGLRAIGLMGDGPLDALGTPRAMYAGMVHIMLPYVVLPVYAALAGLDPRLLRAAQSLGAGAWLTLRAVVLPAIRAGVVSGAMLVLILSLGFFVTPALLGGPTNLTVATLINRQFQVSASANEAIGMAALLLLAVLLVYVVADRFFAVSARVGAGR